jgi:tetratricopeptide (TPR) repeat protein
MPGWLKISAAVTGLAILAFVTFIVLIPLLKGRTLDSCALLAEQQFAAIDVETTLNDLDLVKAKLGISAGQIQDVDMLLKDYAFKYAANCRDREKGAVEEAEYTCKRDNMDRALGSARSLALALAEVKVIQDASAQRDVVLKHIETIHQLAEADFSAHCGAELVVNPGALTFHDHFPERTLQIANAGVRDGSYAIVELPEAFLAHPVSGEIRAGGDDTIAITRAALPVSQGSEITFFVRDERGRRIPVKIDIDAENAGLYADLASRMRASLPAGAEPTVEDAQRIVEATVPIKVSDGTKVFLAAGILKHAGNLGEASKAVDILEERDKALFAEPSTQFAIGVINLRTNRPQPALENFQNAGRAWANLDPAAQAKASVFAGAALLQAGHEEEALKYFESSQVKDAIARDPNARKRWEEILGGADGHELGVGDHERASAWLRREGGGA